MKRILFIISVVFVQVTANAQDSLPPSNPIITQIQALDFSQYVGRPVDTLLSNLPSGYIQLSI